MKTTFILNPGGGSGNGSGTLTGGGTIATGGFTLTIPATGTAALLGTANVFSANQSIGSGLTLDWNSDLYLGRSAAATLLLGVTHATTATAQTIVSHNVTTGTGANMIIGAGTGSVAGGSVILSTRATTGALTARLTVAAGGDVTIANNIYAAQYLSSGAWIAGNTGSYGVVKTSSAGFYVESNALNVVRVYNNASGGLVVDSGLGIGFSDNGAGGGANNLSVAWSYGTASPEGSLTRPQGSIYSRNNGGTGEFWLKTTGTGNTGWTKIL